MAFTPAANGCAQLLCVAANFSRRFFSRGSSSKKSEAYGPSSQKIGLV
jgi:hypothetical protein